MEDDKATGLAMDCDPTSYEFSGKVMLISILVLCLVLAIIGCFHLCRSRHLRQAHRLALNSDHNTNTTTPTTSSSSKGLEPSVLKSLPIFYVSKAKGHGPPLECAVCLSELENNETGRVLPKCNHCFHIDCIDMWFQSHSSCPLCRAPVQPVSLIAITIQM